MLTPRMAELLTFIDDHIRETGTAPTFDMMRETLGLSSKGGIFRLLTSLEERGFIRRAKHRERAIEVLRLPRDAAADTPTRAPAPSPLSQREQLQAELDTYEKRVDALIAALDRLDAAVPEDDDDAEIDPPEPDRSEERTFA